MGIEKIVVRGDSLPTDVVDLRDRVVVLEKVRKVAITTTKRSIEKEALPMLPEEAGTLLTNTKEQCPSDRCGAQVSEAYRYVPELSCHIHAMGVTCVNACAGWGLETSCSLGCWYAVPQKRLDGISRSGKVVAQDALQNIPQEEQVYSQAGAEAMQRASEQEPQRRSVIAEHHLLAWLHTVLASVAYCCCFR